MPDINELDLIPKIKELQPEAVIIALTAFATPADKEKCLHAGCDYYLSKPTESKTLLGKILGSQ